MPKTSTSSTESGSGSAKKDIPTNKHGGKDPWKAIVDQQTKTHQVLIAKEKAKRDETTKNLKADLTILALEKEHKRNQNTEDKNKHGKELQEQHAKHLQDLRAQRENLIQRAKSVNGELTIQKARSDGDAEDKRKYEEKLDNETVQASKEAAKNQLKADQQKRANLKKAITENQLVGEVRKIMNQDQAKEDQSLHKKQVDQTIKAQVQRENDHKERFRKISNQQEERTTEFAQQVHYTNQKKDKEYHDNLDTEIKDRQNQQNRKFLDNLLKDKQTKQAVNAANRSQMGQVEANKTFERHDYSKKVQEGREATKSYISGLAAEREDRLKKQKEYKLHLDQQAFNSTEKRRNADDMTEHELKMNQKAIDAFTSGEHHDHCGIPGFSDPTAQRRATVASSTTSRRSSFNSQLSAGLGRSGKKPTYNPITGAEVAYNSESIRSPTNGKKPTYNPVTGAEVAC